MSSRIVSWLAAAALVAVPVALVAWVGWRGRTARLPETGPRALAAAQAAAASGGEGAATPGPERDAGPAVTAAASPGASPDAAAPVDPDERLRALFAAPLPAVRLRGDVALYDAGGLFDYIDGAAPVYVERQFRRLAAAELATPDGHELTADVYDMTSAAGAESIFALERSPAARPVEGWPGAEAVSGPLALVFRHDRYYVKLTAFDAAAEATLPALARALRERLR